MAHNIDLLTLQEMAMASAVPKPIPVRTAGLQTVLMILVCILTLPLILVCVILFVDFHRIHFLIAFGQLHSTKCAFANIMVQIPDRESAFLLPGIYG